MNQPVRILHLEDDPADCELIPATLEAGGILAHSRPVSARAEYIEALEEGGFDLILADCKLPSFNGLEALALARERRPEVPFLFVSGFIGEEAALDSLQHGATDYVFKHNLARLAPAVRRALQEARAQRERRQAEAALQEREATLDSFFNTAPFLMGVIELLPDDMRIVSANAATARFAGMTPGLLRGRKVRAAASWWDWLEPVIAQLREAGRSGRPFEAELAREWEGRTRWLSITVSPIPVAPGGPPRFCYVAADVTGKKQMEEHFLRAQRLESAGTLASGIAHDLNNVLAPLVMSLRLFRSKLTDLEDIEILAAIEASARRGADIIRQVLTFARGTPGGREPVCLSRLVEDLGRMLRESFPRSIGVDLGAAPDLATVLGDATQLYQVLMNLCVNARDAMPGGGRLTVRLENAAPGTAEPAPMSGAPAAGYVVMTVADTGGGIGAADLGRIFDPFFSTKPTGTGLGLSTALTLVKGHGGFITVASAPGQGAVFKVFLPAAPGASTPPPDGPGAEVPRGQGEWIVLVDDDPTVRRVSEATLAHHGYRVRTAADGAEALRLLEQAGTEIAMVVTDLMMPGLGGGVLLRLLRERFPGIPLIAMSGLPEHQALGGAPAPGGVPFLPKPFSAEQLLEAVRGGLERRRRICPC